MCRTTHVNVTSDKSEIQIVQEGGLGPILDGAASPDRELQSQCARALRNLSVNREHIPWYTVQMSSQYAARRVKYSMCHSPYVRVPCRNVSQATRESLDSFIGKSTVGERADAPMHSCTHAPMHSCTHATMHSTNTVNRKRHAVYLMCTAVGVTL